MVSGPAAEKGVLPPPPTMPPGLFYDPRARGALCDKCPLKDQVPVVPTVPTNVIGTVVGEGPGVDEVKRGRPFVGRSGRVLDSMLNRAGLDRNALQINNATLCPPKTKTPGELTKAAKCCAPRLRSEVVEPLLILGKTALRILKPGLKSLDSVRGYVLE